MAVTASPRRLLSRAEVAQLLGGLSVRTVERLEERGELIALRIGRRVVFEAAAVDRYVRRLAAAGAAR